MDSDTGFNLEIRVIACNCTGRWFCFNKVVDADLTSFKDLIDEVAENHPPMGGDILSICYWCMDTNANIKVRNDKDVVDIRLQNDAC